MTAVAPPLVVPAVREFLAGANSLLIDGQWIQAAMYGLAAGVWTTDISKAHRTAQQSKMGSMWINQYNGFYTAMPFGGYKHPGGAANSAGRRLTSTPRSSRSMALYERRQPPGLRPIGRQVGG